jgi:hypothetical protein
MHEPLSFFYSVISISSTEEAQMCVRSTRIYIRDLYLLLYTRVHVFYAFYATISKTESPTVGRFLQRYVRRDERAGFSAK